MSPTPLRLAAPALLVALAACTSTPDAANPPPSSDVLSSHHWLLESAITADDERIDALFPGDRRLTLDFDDGRLAVSGGCNGAGASYHFDDAGRLQVGEIASTRMACAPPLMAADRAVAELLNADPLQLRVEAGTPPRLVLESADGALSRWVGEPTAEQRHGGPGTVVFLEVAPEKVACSHPLIPSHQCLRVREVRYDADGLRQSPAGEWQPLYGEIEGFAFVPGEHKVLRVKRFTREAPPADASAVVYVLDMVVESGIAPTP